MRAATERLGQVLMKKNGDPAAIKVGTQALEEFKKRNATPANGGANGAPSLLQPRNPPFRQQPPQLQDPWRNPPSAGGSFGSMGYQQPSAQTGNSPYQPPGTPYQPQPVGPPGEVSLLIFSNQ